MILGYSLWQTHFEGDESVIGGVVRLNGVDRRIVGVMPSGFSHPSTKVQLWIPRRMDASNFLEYWGSQFMPLVGRLWAGISLGQTQADARGFGRGPLADHAAWRHSHGFAGVAGRADRSGEGVAGGVNGRVAVVSADPGAMGVYIFSR